MGDVIVVPYRRPLSLCEFFSSNAAGSYQAAILLFSQQLTTDNGRERARASSPLPMWEAAPASPACPELVEGSDAEGLAILREAMAHVAIVRLGP